MAASRIGDYVVTIRNFKPPVKDNNSKLLWSIDVTVEQKSVYRQVHDPWNRAVKKDCRWYIEDFAANEPYNTTRARTTMNHLKTYASSLQRDLKLEKIYVTLPRGNSGRRTIVLEVYDDRKRNSMHQLHWELLEHPDLWKGKNIEVQVRRSVQMSGIGNQNFMDIRLWQPTPDTPPSFNILLVVARDTSQNGDIDPTFALGILTDLQQKYHSLHGTSVNLEIVRPGTVDALEEHLARSRAVRGDGYFHLLHFDLHGEIKETEDLGISSFLRFNKRKENSTVSNELVDERPERIGKILQDYGITMVVLNACESANANYGETTNIAKIFTSWGVSNIVAMSFKVLESGAKVFLASFYQHFIAERLDFSAAAALARQAIRCDPVRSARLNLSLRIVDWFVPVVYCHGFPMRMGLQKASCEFVSEPESCTVLPVDNNFVKDSCFIGRDFDILRLENRLLAKHPAAQNVLNVHGEEKVPAVWLCGPPGIGKSTLLLQISSLWTRTSFFDAILYIDFAANLVRNMNDFITELLVHLPSPTDVPRHSRMETGEELVLRLLRDRRVCFMLDGLHIIGDNDEHQNSANLSEINVFLKMIVKAQERSVRNTGCCFYIFSGRLKRRCQQIDYCRTATIFELGGLQPRSCEDLLQLMMPVDKPDIQYYELFTSLHQGIPAALVHFGNLARASGLGIQELYETCLCSDVDKCLESRTKNRECHIFQELEQRFSKLSSEELAVVLAIGWYWHEGPVVESFYDSLMLSRICREDFELTKVLKLVSNWGYIQLNRTAIDTKEEKIINWIHPLFTVYCRMIACAFFRSKSDPSNISRFLYWNGLVHNVAARVTYWILPKTGLQLSCQFLASALGAYQYTSFNHRYYAFATWFLNDIDSTSDRDLPIFTAPQKATDSDAVEARGKKGLQNILFASKICLGQGPIVITLSRWPIKSLLFYVQSFRKVSTVSEITVLARYVEELFDKIETQEGMALEGGQLHFALGLACSLATIHTKYIPSLAKHHIKFMDFGMKMIEISESKCGPQPDLQKGLLFHLKAELLLTEGKEFEAHEAWNTGLNYGRASLQTVKMNLEEGERHGISFDSKMVRDDINSLNQFFDNLDNSWDIVLQHHRGDMHPTKKFPEEIRKLDALHGDNLEHLIHNLNKIDRKYDALGAVAQSGPGGGNSLMAVAYHRDFMRDAIQRQDLDQARTHRDAIIDLLETDPTHSANTQFYRTVTGAIGPLPKPFLRKIVSMMHHSKDETEEQMTELFLEGTDADLHGYRSELELANLVVEDLD